MFFLIFLLSIELQNQSIGQKISWQNVFMYCLLTLQGVGCHSDKATNEHDGNTAQLNVPVCVALLCLSIQEK